MDTTPAALDCLTATISDIQENYANGSWSAVSVLHSYLAQIDAHNQYLHAILELAPKTQLQELARRLDEERKTSGIRSFLYGIPVIVKVMYSATLKFGCPTNTSLPPG
jgi:amidase